jgi:UDP-glucose 4-epimerase
MSVGTKENLTLLETVGGSKFSFVQQDISDVKTVAVIETFKPERIFHLGAQANVRRSVAEPHLDAAWNVVGTVNILEGARKSGTKVVVFSSTGGAIYGEQETFPATEDHRNSPECQYGVSKLCGEHYLEFYAKYYKLTCFAMRFGNVYGPRQNPKGEAGVVAIFVDRLIAGQSLTVNGDGGQTRDFIHVDDVANAVLKVSETVQPGRFSVYNVGTGIETSVNQVSDALIAAWNSTEGGKGKKVEVKFGPELPGEQRRSVIDASKLNRDFDWSPRISLEKGLADTLRSFI